MWCYKHWFKSLKKKRENWTQIEADWSLGSPTKMYSILCSSIWTAATATLSTGYGKYVEYLYVLCTLCCVLRTKLKHNTRSKNLTAFTLPSVYFATLLRTGRYAAFWGSALLHCLQTELVSTQRLIAQQSLCLSVCLGLCLSLYDYGNYHCTCFTSVTWNFRLLFKHLSVN